MRKKGDEERDREAGKEEERGSLIAIIVKACSNESVELPGPPSLAFHPIKSYKSNYHYAFYIACIFAHFVINLSIHFCFTNFFLEKNRDLCG